MSDKEIALQLKGITKRFGKLLANDAIDLTLHSGEILALLGENGAGKTTLMNILFGHYVADAGEVCVFGDVLPEGSPHAALEHGVGMVHQHFTLADNMTVLDNITLGTEPLFAFTRSNKAAKEKILKLADQFGLLVDPDVLVKQLSVGERQRVEILKALYRDSRILILDEPTAVLTPQESESLFVTLKLLAAKGLAVIFISHKLKEVMSVSDNCSVLRHGKMVFKTKTGNTNAEELASAMIGGEIPETKKEETELGHELLRINRVSVSSTDEEGGKLDEINLSLFEGEILGVAGVSGNGQKQLAELISGLLTPNKGDVYFDNELITTFSPSAMVKRGVGRVPEDRTGTGLIGDLSIQENLILENYAHKDYSKLGFLRFKNIKNRALKLIESFDVRCMGPLASTRQLSGGNMQKLILARVLSENPKVIIASQPTWGLDVGAAAFVHNQLMDAKNRGAAVLLISEDLDELFKVADRVQVMYHGKLTPPVKPEESDAASFGLAMSGHADTVAITNENRLMKERECV